MAKKKQEEAPKGSPAWMATFSDLMNLLMCFFVLLFSMSSIDESKAEAMLKSLADTFSIFSGGGASFEDGVLISSGSSQLSNLDEYFNTVGQTDDGQSMEDSNNDSTGQQIAGDKVAESDKSDDNSNNSTNQNSDNDQDKNNDKDNTSIQPGDDKDSNSENGEDKNNVDENQAPNGEDKNNVDENQAPNGEDKEHDGETGDDKKNDKDNPAQLTPEQISQMAAAQNLVQNKLETGDMFEEVKGLTEKLNLGDYVNVVLDSDEYEYVQIDINGSVLFDSSSADIKKDAEAVISRLGDVLKQFKDYKIEIIGHTDNLPMGAGARYRTNEELSCARAISIADYLATVKNMGWSNIYYSGRGEHEPIASNATAEGRAQNRRVEIRLYNKRSSK